MLTLEGIQLALGRFSLSANCEIKPGVTAVLGPSGAGKSTILSAIAGFLPMRAGAIKVAGTDLAGTSPGQRPVSILFQDNNLFPHMTLAQNVGLALQPNLRLSQQEVQQVARALRTVGLDGFGARKPGAVSGGQQSRAALARILLAARPVVLLDEPFAALGPGLKAEMLGLVRDTLVSDNRVILMVTHDPDDARAIADYVCVLSDGELAAPLPTATLFADPPAALRAYLGQM